MGISNKVMELQEEIQNLKLILCKKENELKTLLQSLSHEENSNTILSKRDIVRYSRQIIVPQVSVHGQLKLKQLSVLIVGAGGLGCPAALYLAGAGVGRLGLIDYDVVEVNNLHRQLLHSEDQLGNPKVSSAASALKRINSELVVDELKTQLSSANALELVSRYDMVVDASDNVATRYLVNDACVLTQRPLVSGSALQLEGQLTVYHYDDGPCYRCIYPTPPPPETINNCSDAGVLGAVPGVIGTLQALEVMKIALGMEGVLSGKLLLFDGENTTFRKINLRKRNQDCPVCGTTPTITQLMDYEQFCGAAANDKERKLRLLKEDDRVSPEELHQAMTADPARCVVIDVRQELEYQMCSLPGSLNLPLASLARHVDQIRSKAEQVKSDSPVLVCMVCRRGNDSQLAVHTLQPLLSDVTLRDLRGGLHAWAGTVDPTFPVY